MRLHPAMLACICWLIFSSLVSEAAAGRQYPGLLLLFWDKSDVTNAFGKLTFGGERLRADLSAKGFPNMQFGCEKPREDGAAWIYGWRMAQWEDRSRRKIEVVRCVTKDGVHFSEEQTVFAKTNSEWQGFANIVLRPSDGALFLFAWAPGALHVFRSENGKDWRLLTEKAYSDHDAMCIIWYQPLGEFVNFQNTLEAFPKRYPDNIGAHRRVASFRRSPDGVQWKSFSPPFLDNKLIWTPDKDDPEDLEFYRSIVFPTEGRYAMLLQDYIAPPPEANSRRAKTRHGPRSEVEWAISRDGLNWSRPFRDIDVTENTGGLPVQGPLIRDGMMRFYSPDGNIVSLPEGRKFFVSCAGNGEFSTPTFAMPAAGLYLNAYALYRPTEGPAGRAYILAELRSENDEVLRGFERGKCLVANQDGCRIPLRWDGSDGSSLAGKNVKIRFYLRDAKIYSVTSGNDLK